MVAMLDDGAAIDRNALHQRCGAVLESERRHRRGLDHLPGGEAKADRLERSARWLPHRREKRTSTELEIPPALEARTAHALDRRGEALGHVEAVQARAKIGARGPDADLELRRLGRTHARTYPRHVRAMAELGAAIYDFGARSDQTCQNRACPA